jgi:hypothetical protein
MGITSCPQSCAWFQAPRVSADFLFSDEAGNPNRDRLLDLFDGVHGFVPQQPFGDQMIDQGFGVRDDAIEAKPRAPASS